MGRPKLIESPEKLWELFLEYVAYENSKPMYKREYVGKDGREVDTPLLVPITFEGFEVYLIMNDVIGDLGHYSSNLNNAYEEFLPIITRIRKYCFAQNFKGASVGLFNANIIARKLGLIEKQQNDITVTQPLFPDVQTDKGSQ